MDFISHMTVLAATTTSSMSPDFISKTNDGPAKIAYDYISAFGGVIIAFAIIMAGIKILLSAHKKDAREKAMDSLGKIMIGSFIIGSSLIFAGFIANMAHDTGVQITVNTPSTSKPDDATAGSEDSTFVTRAVADVLDAVPNKIFEWVSGKTMGFEPLDELIFNTGSNDTSKAEMPPFTNDEWHNLNYLYICICTIVAPLLLIMVAKTGVEMVLYSDSTSKKIDLKEELMRWFICAFILGTAPFLVQGLFTFFNSFTDSLGTATKAIWGTGGSASKAAGDGFSIKTIQNLATGSIITTAIIHILYAWVMLKINLVFLSRKIVLSVMYAFTPIAIALWGINKRVHAASIWFGEIITNAAMQFCYAFTFTVMLVALGKDEWNSWFITLVWMSAIIKIADMLRNSLQGFFTRLAGIDEAGLAGGTLGTVGSTFAGMTAAFGMAVANKDFKASSVRDKTLGETFGKSNSKNKAQDNGGIAANMPSSKETPDVKSENGSSPINGTSPIAGETGGSSSSSGGVNPNKGGSGSTPDVKSPNSSSTAKMSSIDGENANLSRAIGNGINPNDDLPPSFQAGDNASTNVNDLSSENSNENAENPNDDLPPSFQAGSDDSTNVTDNGLPPTEGNTNTNTVSDKKKQGSLADGFKKKSNEQNLYNAMLADNLNREMAKSSRRSASGIVTGAMQAMTMNDPTMKGFAQGVGNITAGIQKRKAVARAINKTADQMQQLSGTNKDGKYNMSKKEAMNTLFAGNNDAKANFKNLKVLNNPINKVLNATANTEKGKSFRNFVNKESFTSHIVKGNNEGAAMDLAAAHPFNKLSDNDKTKIIAQTNPYTSIDGFSHWDDNEEDFNYDY